MIADRRIHTARSARLGTHQLLIERRPHAVQALKLVAVDPARFGEDGRDAERVVGGELRIDTGSRRKQLAGAGNE